MYQFGLRPFLLVLFLVGASVGELDVDFALGAIGQFVPTDECKMEDFKMDKYSDNPDIFPPHETNGFFLKITKSGCLITKPLDVPPGSRIVLVYRTISPGIRFQILVGDDVYEPALDYTSWGTFIEHIAEAHENTQVKLVATVSEGQPLLVIDRFQITSDGSSSSDSTPVTTNTTTATEKIDQRGTNVAEETAETSAARTTGIVGTTSKAAAEAAAGLTAPTAINATTESPGEFGKDLKNISKPSDDRVEDKPFRIDYSNVNEDKFWFPINIDDSGIYIEPEVEAEPRVDFDLFREKFVGNKSSDTLTEEIRKADIGFWSRAAFDMIIVAIIVIACFFAIILFLINSRCVA